jgi:predicted AAA+ superfamily ATPase
MSLRYFYEQIPELHVVAAGSLLEFALKDISFPVGRVQLLSMYPLNFYEYLKATKKDLLAETLVKEPVDLSDAVHNSIREEMRNYFVIGGMPECVKTFVDDGSFSDVLQVQVNLLATFRQDFSKYAAYSDKQCLNQVLASVAQNVGQQIKYTRLSDSFSNPTIRKAFELLETARLFKKVKAASPEGIPLGASTVENKFKAVFLDIGLLSCINNLAHNPDFQKQNLLAIFKGALAEQFVGQEIASSGHENLYYWSRQAKSSSAETDYLVEVDGDIIPIEVKSGPSGRLKSLHLLFESYKNISKAFVFSDQKYGKIEKQKLIFHPLYYAYGVLKK